MIIDRNAIAAVRRALSRQAAVALVGPRQVGKTTLALEIARSADAVYLDLERPSDRAKLSAPELYLSQYPDKLVILDEIHRTPELFQTLRGIIDERRRISTSRAGHTGQFLVLGSAAIELLRQSGESLAGRIEYVNLGPLAADEIDRGPEQQRRLLLRGGFPDSFLAASDLDSMAWRNNFIRTYLQRDIPQFAPRIPAEALERLWTMLAHSQSTTLNASRIAEGLMVSAPTVSRYIDLLTDLLLVRRVQPFAGHSSKRLVRSPKVYVRDSGIVHALLGIVTHDDLAGHPVVGSSWEGFVVENTLQSIPDHVRTGFYRTAAGAEMDLVLESGSASWAIEIKRGLSPKLTKGFHNARADLKPEKTFVVYSGDDRYPLADGVEAIGVRDLLAELKEM